MEQRPPTSVIGAGAWGTALARVLQPGDPRSPFENAADHTSIGGRIIN